MSETPPEFDLKFLPDWLKEGAAKPSYADFEGPRDEGRRFNDRGGGRREGGGPPRRPGGGPGRPGGAPGGNRPQGERRGPRSDRPGGPGGPRREGPGGGARGERRGPRREESAPRPPREPRPPATPPVEVKIEFLPEPNAAAGIARQIKQSGRAYPLFGTGRMFLERPERHRVRISSVDPTVVLYQIGDGPIAADQASLERVAFQNLKGEYYKEEVVLGDEIKGNFANVARSRATGIFLGPTNYHSYQPGLRRLYDERFSRRMSFQDFLYNDVEIRTDEQSIADWKEQARSTTTYVTTQEPEPITFKTLAETEQHFRAHYLRAALKAGLSLECSGQASRQITDRSMINALRDTWERERGFPVQLVNNLRPYLTQEGLHFFKHKKRILYVSAVRPLRHAAGQPISQGVEAILKTIETSPKCTRRDLAAKILGAQSEAPEFAEQKEGLAKDLHYLIHSGQVIEFHDGTLDLPMAPGAKPPQGGGKAGKGGKSPASEEAELSPEEMAESAAAEGFTAEAAQAQDAGELQSAAPEPPAESGLAASESLTSAETVEPAEATGSLIAESAETVSEVHGGGFESSGGEAFAPSLTTHDAPPEQPLSALPEGANPPSHDFAGSEGGLGSHGILQGSAGPETASALGGELQTAAAPEASLPSTQSLQESTPATEAIQPVLTDHPAHTGEQSAP